MFLNLCVGDKLFHKYLGDIEVVSLSEIGIQADTGTRGVFDFKFYDFGKVLFFETDHSKKSFKTYDEYGEFCKKDKVLKMELAAEAEIELQQSLKRRMLIEESIREKREKQKQIEIEKEREKKQKQFELEQNLIRIKMESKEVSDIMDKLIDLTKEHIKILPNLKSLNDIFRNHRNGQYAYSNIFEQRLYLLRYFYAYYYEYKQMIIKICEFLTEVSIVSIGCGSVIDGLALKNIACTTKKKFSYIGVDIVEWVDGILLSKDDKIKLHKVNIKEDTENYLKDATVLFFPKSLSDISSDAMHDITKWIKKATCNKQEICIAASFIYNGKEVDIWRRQYHRYNDIIKLFNEKGYVVDETRRDEVLKKEDSNAIIWKVDEEMFKPTNLLNFFHGGIEDICNHYVENKVHCNICEKDDNECNYAKPKYSAAAVYYKSTILIKER